MQMNCKFCPMVFVSLIITPEEAVKQIQFSHAEHLRRKHPDMIKEVGEIIGKVQGALVEYLTLEGMAVIPETEVYLTGRKEKALDIVMASLGFSPGDASGAGDAGSTP